MYFTSSERASRGETLDRPLVHCQHYSLVLCLVTAPAQAYKFFIWQCAVKNLYVNLYSIKKYISKISLTQFLIHCSEHKKIGNLSFPNSRAE